MYYYTSYDYTYGDYHYNTGYNSYNLCGGQSCNSSSQCLYYSCTGYTYKYCDYSYTYYTYYNGGSSQRLDVIIGPIISVIIIIAIVGCIVRRIRHRRLLANLHHHHSDVVIAYQAPQTETILVQSTTIEAAHCQEQPPVNYQPSMNASVF